MIIHFLKLFIVLFVCTEISAQTLPPTKLTVSQDGSGDFKTIQEAINSVRDLAYNRVTIFIKNGIYKEKLVIPWRQYAKTVLINCELGKHIVAEGWNPWTGDAMFPDKEKTTYYAEFNSRGPGANSSKRASWSRQLTSIEAKKYTIKNIFGNWNPETIKN